MSIKISSIYGLNYNIEEPRMPLNFQVVWTSEEVLRYGLLKGLGRKFVDQISWPDEVRLFEDVCNRNYFPQLINQIVGRSIVLPSKKPLTLRDIPYDSNEISGFGHQIFYMNQGERSGFVDNDDPIKIPSTDNFMEFYPSIGTSSYIEGGQVRHIESEFRFAGAYLREEAVRKAVNTLVALNTVKPEYPILFPLPIAIGIYNELHDETHGNPFAVYFKVPYLGKRTGVKVDIRDEQDLFTFIRTIDDSIFPIARAIRSLHDMGITHNSLVPSNYMASPKNPVLIADLATIRRFNPHAEDSAMQRAFDLSRPVIDAIQVHKTFEGQSHLIDFVLKMVSDALSGYLGENKRFDPLMPNTKLGLEILRHPENLIKMVLDRTNLKGNGLNRFNFDLANKLQSQILNEI